VKTNLAALLVTCRTPGTIDLAKIELEPADYIRNADGSIDYFISRLVKAHKLEQSHE
jgi:hypothetical protein